MSSGPNLGPTFLSGKVATGDGSPFTERVVIQSICQGNVRNEGHTDSRGYFSINLSDKTRNAVESVDQADVPMATGSLSMKRTGTRDLRDCSLQASLAGFWSEAIELRSKAFDMGSADVGTILLHRIIQVEGLTVSVTTASAPPAARKEYEKGQADTRKGKWDSAGKRFTKAVEIYPRFAAAWFELGWAQLQQNDEAAARNSFARAAEADSKFLSPHEELAKMALKVKAWKELAQETDVLVALDPFEHPQYWFYNSAANYYLGDIIKAEQSAQHCISLDERHRFPRAEYVMGMILVKKRDYAGAAAHISAYVRLAPEAPDVEIAKKQIAELEASAALVQSQKQ
jgi:tetratricopeptide (TPR) repeat protein